MGSTTGADDGSADRARSLAAWFAQRHPHAHDVSVRDIGGPHASGYSNETVFFRACWNEAAESREARYVARIEPRTPPVYPQQTATAMAAVELQYRVMQAVTRAGGVPVPPLAGYEPGTDLLGAPFYVMGFVDGDVPKDNPVYTSEGFYVDAAPVERYRAIDDGLRVLARLHAIDPVAAGLDWLAGGRTPGLVRQLEIFRRYASELLAGRPHPVLANAFAWLEEESASDGPAVLLWGDARPGNMIFRDFRCVAANDWEGAALGPAELDLGWWLALDRFAHEGSGLPRLEGEPSREEQIALYERHAGRSVRDPFWHEVFAAARFTIVMIRTCQRMTDAGTVPDSMNMPVNNPATQLLADMLGIPYSWQAAAGLTT